MNIAKSTDGGVDIFALQGERLSLVVNVLEMGDLTAKVSRMQVRSSTDELWGDLSSELANDDGSLQHSPGSIAVIIESPVSARVQQAARYDLFLYPDEVPLMFGHIYVRKAATHE